MDLEARFEALWNHVEDFEFTQERSFCVFAQKFSEWAKELCAKAADDTSIVKINQAKILLVDKYFEWRSVVPKSHRSRVGMTGHFCIFHVFEQAYDGLRAFELALTPPMLFLPAAPAPLLPPPPPQIAGIFIGELDKP